MHIKGEDLKMNYFRPWPIQTY